MIPFLHGKRLSRWLDLAAEDMELPAVQEAALMPTESQVKALSQAMLEKYLEHLQILISRLPRNLMSVPEASAI